MNNLKFGSAAILILLMLWMVFLMASCAGGLHATSLPVATLSDAVEPLPDHPVYPTIAEPEDSQPTGATLSAAERGTTDSTSPADQPETVAESLSDETNEPETTAFTAQDTDVPETASPRPVEQKAVPTGKVAYLTFDDGPDKNNTPRILDTLDAYGVKATFFVVGARVKLYPEQLEDINSRGHAIGCHSYSHNYALCATADGVKSEIAAWEDIVRDTLGEIPDEKLFRFPGGSPIDDDNGGKEAVASLGYEGYDWNCLNNDCYLKKCPSDITADDWLKQTFKQTYAYGSSLKGSPLIILMHETYSETADMLGWAIEFLQNEGYSFDTLDNYDGNWYY